MKYGLYFVVTLFLIAIWTFWIAPEIKKIPDDFSYSANILSLDNFYDQTSKKFEGEHISKTTFSYDVIDKKNNHLVVNNSFKVKKISDKPIFSVSRLYFINPYNEQHVIVPGEEKRKGYLFAPRYTSKKPFYYWHINYDAPALMTFVNKDVIDGLTTYHYQAQYEADQTANLSYLPGVPTKRGIRANIKLQLWIEPISGWLVKYQDNTLAYYYDKNTGKALVPWNSFSNRYTPRSIHEKVREARRLKWLDLSVDFGVPILIIGIFLLIFFISRVNYFSRVKRLLPLRYIPIGLAFLLIMATIIFTLYYFFITHRRPAIYKIGVSYWTNNLELLSAVRGFKDGLAEKGFSEGKNVEFLIKNPDSNIENQIKIIESFVDQKVDLIFTLSTPGTLVAKGVTTKIPIVFSDVSYPIASGIVSLEQSSKSNVVGTLNYIPPAEQFYPFDRAYPGTKILGFVHQKGDPDSEIQYQEYKSMLSQRGIEVVDIPAIDLEDMKHQLEQKLQTNHFDVLFVACDTLIRNKGDEIAAAFMKQHKMPGFTCDKASVMQGVLMGNFADLYSIGKLAGLKAGLILQGAVPGWLTTESTKKGYLIINMFTAKLLGITIPQDELQDVDKLIMKDLK